MRAVTRYILRQLAVVTVFVTTGLTLAVWLTQSLRFVDYIVNRGLPLTDFLLFVAFMLPAFLGIVLPIATFAAMTFVYNKLINDSELVILRSAGVSPIGMARPALVLAVAVTALVYAISLYFLPLSYQAFKDLQHEIRHDYSAVLLEEGVFNRLGPQITVYVRERTDEGTLEGILVHDSRGDDQPVTMMASRGALVQSAQGPRVVLADGNRQVVDPDTGRLSMLYFDRYTVDLGQLQERMQARWREPRERYLPDLLFPGPGPTDQRYRKELIAEGHNRLTYPAYTLAFVGIGLVALLGGEFSRRGQSRRILPAVVAVGALETLHLTLADLATRDLAAVPAMYAVLAAAILVPWMLLLRRRRPRGASPPLARASLEAVR